MRPLSMLKSLAETIPYPIGRLTAHVPYSLRLGGTYTHFSKLIPQFNSYDDKSKGDYVVERLNSVVSYAQENIPFYKRLYGGQTIEIQSLQDFESLPIISKEMVREYVKESDGDYLLNTGGSTGGPLSFYVDKNAWAREWAHMHFIWEVKCYSPSALMITMLGKPLANTLSRYNAVHNELLLDPYSPVEKLVPEFIRLVELYPVVFFQGYPSNIYNIFKSAESYISKDKRKSFVSKIKCLFFSSEYPSDYMVQYLSSEWGLTNYLSWYGHSEMCVLACDFESTGDYYPLHTYGYSEDVDGMLVGTSFHNYSMPLIRYKTEDLISSSANSNGLMSSFRITGGRVSDFILDAHGVKHSLTFFMGRHHQIYNYVDFIQIYQPCPGKAVYYLVPSRGVQLDDRVIRSKFDISDKLAIDFDFQLIKEPVRTGMNKLKLKLSDSDILSVTKSNSSNNSKVSR